MTGRERMTCIVNRRPADRLSWTTLVDSNTISLLPTSRRDMSPLDFCRLIGCDVMQFGNWGLPPDACAQMPFRTTQPVETQSHSDPDGTHVVTSRSRCGTLTWASRGHPVRYAVKTPDDLRTYTDIWHRTQVAEVPDVAESFHRAEAALGDDGIYLLTTSPSPVQQLIEFDMGLENFYYLLHDCPVEMEDLLNVMHSVRMREYELIARHAPVDVICPVENTSSTLTSPAVYERYSLPQIRDLVNIMHAAGKKVILHMCGLLRDLLPVIKQTGLDGINAATPPEVGDTPYEHVLDVMGEDFLLFGAVMSEGVFQTPGVTRDEIWRELDRIYTPRIRRANLVLWLGADGLPTPLDRFLAVRDWMAANGQLE